MALFTRAEKHCRNNKSAVALFAAMMALAFLLIAAGMTSGVSAQGMPPMPMVPIISGFGQPFAALLQPANVDDLQRLADGQAEFLQVEELPKIGPIFNSRSCGSCHFQPALGGSGAFINEMRVRNNTAGGPLHLFASDNLLRLGPQSQGRFTIFPNGVEATPIGCQITSERCAKSACQREEMRRTTFKPRLPICDPTSPAFQAGENCVAERQSTPLFGLGLVEAVADQTLRDLAASQPPPIRGEVKIVDELGARRAGRFGWKNDHATLRAFAADAYLNEMGVTSPDQPEERSTCALNKTRFGVILDLADEPEDETEDDGRADIDRFADFMRATEAPPPIALSASAQAGHQLFGSLGCGGCHTETLTTAVNPAAFIPPTTGGIALSATMNSVLAKQTFHPFSDFLLHDMGSLGDGITSDEAGPKQMRTAPLWGLRGRSRFLHDGRAATVTEAITLHDGQGGHAARGFGGLTSAQQADLLAFLGSI